MAGGGGNMRVGRIGAGSNTRLRHIPGFQAIDGVELAAVCNRSAESGRRVADEFDIGRVTTDPEEIFGDDSIDAVCIGTWPYRHREYTVRALEAGKHVLCEARMAMDGGEAREMLAASLARPELVAQIVPAPFDFPRWRPIRGLVREGALGELREVQATVLNGNSHGEAPPHGVGRCSDDDPLIGHADHGTHVHGNHRIGEFDEPFGAHVDRGDE